MKAARSGFAMGLSAVILATSMPQAADAQGRRIRVVRDAETEQLVRDYVAPILNAAGIGARNIEIVLVGDNSFNAFVADGRRIFVNTGALLQSKTPNEIIGVLAHETGHLAGGHLARRREALAQAQTLAVIGALLGAGALAAGAASNRNSGTQAGAAVLSGSQSIAQRSFLEYARGEELAADRAGFTYMERTRQSSRGMLTVFRRFADQAIFRTRFTDPYLLSHPLPNDRIRQLERLVVRSRYVDKKDSNDFLHRHELMRAKLLAFTQHPKRVDRSYPRSDKSLAARYARAIIAHRFGKPKRAISLIDGLIKTEPRNPFFWELKGQAYLESGNPRQAVKPLRKAVSLAPQSGLLQLYLGQAMVASDRNNLLPEAIRNLNAGLTREPNSALGYRFLAQAYARQGKIAQAELATAQSRFVSGALRQAKVHAKRAQRNLKRGSPAWLRADDIISYTPPKF
ncbi:M48 family metalloprotease [Coralliovum pocilloporae]|uniref:M48 family metalloprotease n=1 Tax=Coralliovum pocilloporae TaxID=3066369 RepID=UPI0033076195